MELVLIYLILFNKIAITVLLIFLHFSVFSPQNLPSWVRIRIFKADPDPGGKINSDQCGSGSTALERALESTKTIKGGVDRTLYSKGRRRQDT